MTETTETQTQTQTEPAEQQTAQNEPQETAQQPDLTGGQPQPQDAAADAPNNPTDGTEPGPGGGEPNNEETPEAAEPAPFKLPEGMTLDPTVEKGFRELAGKLNISHEHAQALLDFEAEHIKTLSSKIRDQQAKNFEAQVEQWGQQTRQELGPDADQKIAVALEAVQKLGGPEFQDLVSDYGLVNHPTFIKTFINIGEHIQEDKFVPGKPAQAKDKTFAEAMYGPKESDK